MSAETLVCSGGRASDAEYWRNLLSALEQLLGEVRRDAFPTREGVTPFLVDMRDGNEMFVRKRKLVVGVPEEAAGVRRLFIGREVSKVARIFDPPSQARWFLHVIDSYKGLHGQRFSEALHDQMSRQRAKELLLRVLPPIIQSYRNSFSP